jgi:acyl-coenzyme A synthetase/AMP-(fatty) acid ligase
MFYEGLNANIDRIKDMSYVGTMLAAGAKMAPKVLKASEELYASKGCTKRIKNAYGQNELGGAVTTNTNTYNTYGSGGFPVIGTEVRILDPKTNTVLGPNEEGRIVENASSCFLNYENKEEQTIKSFIELDDGSVWFDTKDLGYIDNDGNIFITGRLSRVMVRFNCKKAIEPIEEKVKSLKEVKDCAIVTIKQNEDDEDDYPIYFVSLKDNVENIDIVEKLSGTKNSLSEFETPGEVVFLENLPYMTNGKINLVELNNIAQELYGKKTLKK